MRDGQPYPIKDSAEVLSLMQAARQLGEVSQVAMAVLADERLWGEDLCRIPGLAEQVIHGLSRIKALGVKAAIAELLAGH